MPVSQETVSYTDIQGDTYLQILFFTKHNMENKAFAPRLHIGQNRWHENLEKAHTLLTTNINQTLTNIHKHSLIHNCKNKIFVTYPDEFFSLSERNIIHPSTKSAMLMVQGNGIRFHS